MQIEVVSARFRNGVHDYWFSPNGLVLNVGNYVIVDTEKGKDIVRITKGASLVDESKIEGALKNVLKIASQKELDEGEENYKKANSLYPEIKAIVNKEGLDMKVVNVESNYNFSRLTINFTSEDRVDFRELVKKLADKYKTRIELRQIGPRDATRLIGGLGICGKVCCCKEGFGINDYVSIKMAKNQGLSLNPNNISGLCGKLLCCLAYENPYYVEALKVMPKINSKVTTEEGEGVAIYNDLLNKTVSVKFENDSSSEVKSFPLDQIKFKNDNK
ncbi:MAG: stage 0 sporulation protein [Clostridiales bacterium]|nr:stage 0 sporulation protein [Clostridiales bacterium]